MRKWTYPYLEALSEQVWNMNEIFRSPGRAEVRKADFRFFGSRGRVEERKWNFTSLEVPTEMKWTYVFYFWSFEISVNILRNQK